MIPLQAAPRQGQHPDRDVLTHGADPTFFHEGFTLTFTLPASGYADAFFFGTFMASLVYAALFCFFIRVFRYGSRSARYVAGFWLMILVAAYRLSIEAVLMTFWSSLLFVGVTRWIALARSHQDEFRAIESRIAGRCGVKLLQLTHLLPWPPVDGGKKGILGFVRHYRAHPAVTAHTLISMCPLSQVQWAREWHPEGEAPRFEFLDTRNRVPPLLANTLFSRLPYNMAKYQRPGFAAKIAAGIGERMPDMVHFDGAHTAGYAPLVRRLAPGAVRVLRCHNAEHVILERFAAGQCNPLKRALLALQARRLKRYEARLLDWFDLILAITEEDAARFRALNPASAPRTIIVPAGADLLPALPPMPPQASPLRLLHVAAMDWLPNQDGLRWLLRDVVPLLDAQGLDYRLDVVGKAMPREFLSFRHPRVAVHGFVEDLSVLTSAAHLAVVPLHVGGGMRVKILDYWSQGIAVVATPVGAEGLSGGDPPAVAVPDTPQAFAATIARLGADWHGREALRRAGFERASRGYGWPSLVDRVICTVRDRHGR